MLISASTLQGLFTWPEMPNSLVPALLGRPNDENQSAPRRKIDRIALFRAQKDLRILPNNTFNIEEHNTYACPWHHNMTAVIASFRVAKALKFNPGSTFDIHSFKWYNSVPFAWKSQQLMDLGLMEPGQWF